TKPEIIQKLDRAARLMSNMPSSSTGDCRLQRGKKRSDEFVVDHLNRPCQLSVERSSTPLPYRQHTSDVRTANVSLKAEIQFCQSSARRRSQT
ncbi:hypothetical protein, partial [Agrobacterium tumefaciens]|uniref:hypothetical protein n=1 Tax=Agrobacterium tumefaciens TaxID=358 RepID=UPI0027D82743